MKTKILIQLFRTLSVLVAVYSLFFNVLPFSQTATAQVETSGTHQQSDRSLQMKKAEQNQFTVRNVYFTGNVHTADPILRRQILMQEGDLFSRPLLYKSLIKLSKLKMIDVVRLEDIEFNLDEEARLVDFTVTVREKRRSK